ncbi:MAG: carboxyl transferase domain-containing protein, partial [Bacteroidales bacterium]|nr:carboxyl transferase domain-containing protein [Bacteroidales bacterium]
MSLKRKTQELVERREQVLLGGGETAIKKQQAMGKMTARERVIALLDEDSFQEYDLFAQHEGRDFDMEKKELPGDGVITGTGKIYGSPI